MAWYRAGGGGIPSSLKTNMDAVLNKKFGTSTTYAPNTWPDNVNLLGPLPEKTASGSVASITDGADGVPVKNWGVTVDATLSGYSAINGTKNTGTGTPETQYTVSLGRTIYGGEADVVNGTGKEVYRLITFDGTQAVLSGNYGTGGYVQYSCSALGIDPDIDKPLYDLQPNLYVDAATGNYRVNSFVGGGIKRIRFNDVRIGDTITSKDEWNAYLSNNPVTIAYPLATPEDFTFTPITPTPETELGVNNFWADEGDSDVTYRADIDLLLGGN